MKTLAIALIFIVAAAVSAILYLKYWLKNTPDNKNLEATIDSEVKKLNLDKSSYGMVIGIYKDGKSFIKGYGSANKDNPTTPDALTVFQIGSVSKLFTAALLQILCDEGSLKMEDSLQQLIGDTIPLSTAAQKITLKQLATHTSGFPGMPKSLLQKATKIAGKANILLDPYSLIESKDILDYLKTTQDTRAPGRFEYSNYGMGLLGHVMELVTNKNFETLASEKLLMPLEMKNTSITLAPATKQHLAQGYNKDGIATPVWTFKILAGAGAFNSNANDMMTFIRANIEDSSNLSRTLIKMHEPQPGGDTGIGWMLPTFIDKLAGNKSVVWHNGMVGGYASYVSIDTQARTGVVILSNKAVDVTILGMMLTRQTRTQSWAPQNIL